jgi:hypothetical protein
MGVSNLLEGSTGASWVIAERYRQVETEGFSADHDDEHDRGEIGIAAMVYARLASQPLDQKGPEVANGWGYPWVLDCAWKPSSVKRDLVKAGALYIAEMDRLLRCLHETVARLNKIAGEGSVDNG